MVSYIECERHSQKVHRLLNLFSRCQETMERKKKANLFEGFPYQKIIRRIFSLTFDPQKQFGINIERLIEFLEDKKIKRNLEGADKRFLNFLSLLEECASKTSIDEELRKRVFRSFKGTTQDERTLMLSLLKKQLNIGVDFSLAQSLVGKDFVQLPRDFMRAGYYKPGMVLEYPLLVEPCIDGERFKLIVTPEGNFQAYDGSFAYHTTRFRQFFPILVKTADRTKKVLEVDILLYLHKNHASSVLYRLFNAELSEEQFWQDMKVYITDAILGDNVTQPYEERRNRIGRLAIQLGSLKGIDVKAMPCIEANNKGEISSLLKRTISEKGIILKDPQSGYSRKRDSLWLKVRPETMRRYSAQIKEVILQHPNNFNSLCGLLVYAEGGITALVKQFSSDKQKSFLSEKGHSLIGRSMEFVLDANDKPLFYRLRPNRTING